MAAGQHCDDGESRSEHGRTKWRNTDAFCDRTSGGCGEPQPLGSSPYWKASESSRQLEGAFLGRQRLPPTVRPGNLERPGTGRRHGRGGLGAAEGRHGEGPSSGWTAHGRALLPDGARPATTRPPVSGRLGGAGDARKPAISDGLRAPLPASRDACSRTPASSELLSRRALVTRLLRGRTERTVPVKKDHAMTASSRDQVSAFFEFGHATSQLAQASCQSWV